MADRKEIQALHSAISRRDWHAVEVAANVLRDQKVDCELAAATIETYYARQIEWSKKTFGPALRTLGILDHIRKELKEIEAEPHDLSEWIDVVILAMDGFWRHGGTVNDLMPRLLAKQTKNMARDWPDWRAMSEDSAIEHDRSRDTVEPPEDDTLKWQWWGGRDEEWCTIGPFNKKEDVIQAAIEERVGEFLAEDGKWYVAVHVVEAQQEPVKLSDYILGADDLVQRAEEDIAESDRASAEYDDGPYFDVTGDQISDLGRRIVIACDEWQGSHGLKFVPSTFSASRNHEHIVVEIEGGDE